MSFTPLRGFYERSYKGFGNRRTIKLGGVNFKTDEYRSRFSQNMKMIIDLG